MPERKARLQAVAESRESERLTEVAPGMKEDLLLKDVREATFRANPNYELVLFDRLPPQQQVLLSDLQKDPDIYGIMRPRQSSGLAVKSVCRDTALLYFTLQQPGRLPSYIKASFGEKCNQAIAELVLDGVLEIERNGEGEAGIFVCGLDAYELLYEARSPITAQGKLARLSIEALQYAQALEIDDVGKLSARMYFYNRLPASPQWLRHLPTPEAVAIYLGIHVGGPNQRALHQNWSSVSPSPRHEGWRMWRPRHEERRSTKSRITYKLYVSPACEYLREALGAVLDVLAFASVTRLKAGLDVYGLLRPDKIVAYFETFERLQDAANRLQDKLAGCPVHGVPFTAEIAGDGLLSWGMDPPRGQQVLAWQERESWRLWLTNRLSAALLTAKAAQSMTVAPWQFAMQRLELEGVNTASWTPTPAIWEEIWSRKE